MKVLLFFMLTAMVFYSSGNRHSTPASPLPLKKSDSSHLIIFAKQIQPILVNHCSPCHFTGGKMYEKLPFDKPETIVSHEPGVMRRIKDEKEIILIKAFIEQEEKSEKQM